MSGTIENLSWVALGRSPLPNGAGVYAVVDEDQTCLTGIANISGGTIETSVFDAFTNTWSGVFTSPVIGSWQPGNTGNTVRRKNSHYDYLFFGNQIHGPISFRNDLGIGSGPSQSILLGGLEITSSILNGMVIGRTNWSIGSFPYSFPGNDETVFAFIQNPDGGGAMMGLHADTLGCNLCYFLNNINVSPAQRGQTSNGTPGNYAPTGTFANGFDLVSQSGFRSLPILNGFDVNAPNFVAESFTYMTKAGGPPNAGPQYNSGNVLYYNYAGKVLGSLDPAIPPSQVIRQVPLAFWELLYYRNANNQVQHFGFGNNIYADQFQNNPKIGLYGTNEGEFFVFSMPAFPSGVVPFLVGLNNQIYLFDIQTSEVYILSFSLTSLKLMPTINLSRLRSE